MDDLVFVLFFISILLNPFNYHISFALHISNCLTCFLFKCHLISLTWLVINVKCFFLETGKRKDVKPPAALKEKGNVLSLCGWKITSLLLVSQCSFDIFSVIGCRWKRAKPRFFSFNRSDLLKGAVPEWFRNNKVVILLIVLFFNCCLTYTANIAVGVPVCSEWISNRAATECTWQAEMIGCTAMSAWFEPQKLCQQL